MAAEAHAQGNALRPTIITIIIASEERPHPLRTLSLLHRMSAASARHWHQALASAPKIQKKTG